MQDLPQPPGPEPTDVIELRSRVPPHAAGKPLLEYLLARFPYHDRATWRSELAGGRVFVDGAPASPDQPVRAGATLCYHKLHREPPVDRTVRLLEVEPALAVVEKPAHLPMHADGPFLRNTLIHLLKTEHELADARLVHRLDRETSGLVVIARTTDARRALERQFSAGSVRKVYHAVVHGCPPDAFACREPIGHSTTSEIALRRAAGGQARDARPARTEFRVEQRGPRAALVRCRPHTGRTHQIRVHLEHCGFPILGDRLYGHPDAHYLAFVHAVKAGADPRQPVAGTPSRQLLHATALAFQHPVSGEDVEFRSALPEEFHRWLLAP